MDVHDGLVAVAVQETERLNRIISEMHADGTLSDLSMKWYGVDITKGPGA